MKALVAVLGIVCACSSGVEPSNRQRPGQDSTGHTPASRQDPDRDRLPEDPTTAASPPFDFRLARVDPDAHRDQLRPCDVRFSERGASPAAECPESTEARALVECAASDGTGVWVDLCLTGALPEVGRRLETRILDPFGGQARHALAVQGRDLGPTRPAPPPATPPRDGFDFSALQHEPRLVGTDQTCRVDFVSELTPVDERDRRLFRYPNEISMRVELRCLHPGGDAWLDLVFGATDAPRIIEVRRGAEVTVRIERAAGGFADYPLVRISRP